ncbi:MAG: hypothetical protein MUE85_17520 [Microscillaceae bacterium]|jgi:hypothetical protein|nr:hypothetical protein [Microscillaceae bacterium]
MIFRIVTQVPNSLQTLSVIAVDANNNVVIKNIVENVAGATPANNPDLFRQLWRMTDINGAVTFQNVYTNSYLSAASGMYQNLSIASDSNSTTPWSLVKQANLPGDSPNAPRSFVIQTTLSDGSVGLVDLTESTTTEGTPIHLWTNNNGPWEGYYNQYWFLEVLRILIVNPNGGSVTITASNNSSEVIEAWDSAIGGNLLGTVSKVNDSITINNAVFYLSAKRKKGNYKVNECANERNQVLDLSQNSNPNFNFYYDDPLRGATVTISANTSR